MTIATVVTSMKDEAPYILEWVAYHKSIGFDHIVVVANDCTDGTHEILTRLKQLGIISYYENEVPPGKKPHSRALKIANACEEVKASDYVIVLDADEFLAVKAKPHTVKALISKMKEHEASAMVIPWRVFGSSGLSDFNDAPVLQRFKLSKSAANNPRAGVKTLFKNDPALRLAIHFPKKYRKGGKTLHPSFEEKWVDAGGKLLDQRQTTWNGGKQTLHRGYAEVAHFMIKSVDEYALKIFRGDGLMNSNRHGLSYWTSADFNDTDDLNLLDLAPNFHDELSKLREDPELSSLHNKSVAGRMQRLEALKKQSESGILIDILKRCATGSLVDEDAEQARALVSTLSPGVKKSSSLAAVETSPKQNESPRNRARASNSVKMFWFRRGRGNTRGNFGDELGPALFTHLTAKDAVWASAAECDIATIGSILSQVSKEAARANRKSELTIWGSGLIEPDVKSLHHSLVTVAVRGQKTINALDLPSSTQTGDPGILASLIVKANKKTHKWGIVPHFSHRSMKEIRQISSDNGCLLIDPTLSVTDVLKNISACEAIISSSLHGLIVADSYGIPCIWLNIKSHKSHDFKFSDYCSGVNRPKFPEVDILGASAMSKLEPQTPPFSIPESVKENLVGKLLEVI